MAVPFVLKDNELRCERVALSVKFLNVPRTCRCYGAGKLSTGLTRVGAISLSLLKNSFPVCLWARGYMRESEAL